MKILVIDDSRAVQAFVQTCLQGPTYELISAQHGKEALGLATSMKPDLVLLDWEMPVMDGPTFLTEFRKLEPKTPVVMMTTKNDPSEIAEVLQLGANEYIMKPFTAEILKEKISFVIG